MRLFISTSLTERYLALAVFLKHSRLLYLLLPRLDFGQLLLGLALASCALGDLFLSRKKEDWFIAGLISFLVGHFFYIILFWKAVNFNAPNWAVISLLIVYAVIFGAILIKKAQKYQIPIVAYISILSVMGIVALHLPSNLNYVSIGAMIFIISDSLLALRMFVVKEEKIKNKLSIGVWSTYITAQFLIFYGFCLTLQGF